MNIKKKMDMRNKEDREIARANITKLPIEFTTICSEQIQLLDIADERDELARENEKLKEQIESYKRELNNVMP